MKKVLELFSCPFVMYGNTQTQCKMVMVSGISFRNSAAEVP